jgi:16S rRNA (guanine(1405)-N(7))-methyltransferase
MNVSDPIDALVDDLLASRKYRALDLPRDTVRDLLTRELAHHSSEKDALKSVREKLHNIVASYLGDPDYTAAQGEFTSAFDRASRPAVEAICRRLLASHASTRERLAILPKFYPRLFALTGVPGTILDLACGLNPFALPWMSLPPHVQYHAYDLHHPRVALINHYFQLEGLQPLGEHRDILVNPPQVSADVAFFFKEAHRFEQRRRGASREFFQALQVNWLLVSLPTENLTGRRSLLDSQRRRMSEILDGLSWPVEEILFDREIVFCIQRHGQT